MSKCHKTIQQVTKITHLGNVSCKVKQVLNFQIWPVNREIREKRTVVHVLHNDEQRLLSESIDLHDVLMLERLHDLSLSLEISELLIRLNHPEQFDSHRSLVFKRFHVAAEHVSVIALQTRFVESQLKNQDFDSTYSANLALKNDPRPVELQHAGNAAVVSVKVIRSIKCDRR